MERCGRWRGGITCRRYFDVGVNGVADGETASDWERTRGVRTAGIGTPRAFASFARRWGGMGAFGGAQGGGGDGDGRSEEGIWCEGEKGRNGMQAASTLATATTQTRSLDRLIRPARQPAVAGTKSRHKEAAKQKAAASLSSCRQHCFRIFSLFFLLSTRHPDADSYGPPAPRRSSPDPCFWLLSYRARPSLHFGVFVPPGSLSGRAACCKPASWVSLYYHTTHPQLVFI